MSDGQWAGELEGLLQKLSLHFVSKDDLQVSLRDLELRILKEVTHHVSVTKQTPTSETIMSAVNEAGISGITEAVCRQTCTVAGQGHGVLLAGPPMPASRPKGAFACGCDVTALSRARRAEGPALCAV